MKVTLLPLLLAAGCAVTGVDAPPLDDSDQAVSRPPGAEDPAGGDAAAAAGLETTTTYFAEPEHLNVVGECEFRTCPPKGKFCTGTTSPYKVVSRSPC